MRHDPGSVLAGPLSIPRSLVSYVGCATGALRYLDVDCDVVEVSGRSGYAFLYVTRGQAEVPAPVLFDWTVLEDGTRSLGREVEVLSVEYEEEKVQRELVDELLERVRTEIAAGRPCVVWGAAGRPEFAAVYGVRDRNLLVRSRRQNDDEDTVPIDRLQSAGTVGGVFFGEQLGVPERADRDSLARAVTLLRGRHGCYGAEENRGIAAFDGLARSLERARAVPNRVTEQLAEWSDMLGAGAGYLRRLARRLEGASEQFNDASGEFGDASELLRCNADEGEARAVAEALGVCRKRVEAAVGLLEDALALVR